MENEAKITVTLSNGLSVRIPVKNWRETVEKMEANIKKANQNKY